MKHIEIATSSNIIHQNAVTTIGTIGKMEFSEDRTLAEIFDRQACKCDPFQQLLVSLDIH